MSGKVSINIAAHMVITIAALILWIISVWLLKRRKPSRTCSDNIYHKFIDYLKKQGNIRESLSYVLGAFTITTSLMMVLDFISPEPATWNLQAVRIVLLVLSSVIIGMSGYYVYRSFARLAIHKEDKVTAMLKDIRNYFDADEAKRFGKFEQEYTSALNAAGTH